jgi:threonine dehydratase
MVVMASLRLPTLADVFAAKIMVNKYIKPTPLIHSPGLSSALGCEVYLKLENLQPTRAFKVRGGINYFCRMGKEAIRKGVVTASTGNHAQSIAYAGRIFGSRVKIVMPFGVPQIKIDAVKELGAEVVLHGSFFEEALAYAKDISEAEGRLFVHPVNEVLLYHGVATMHLEVLEELPDLDVVINPIGGGSGCSGACLVFKNLRPSVKVIGVQAEGAPAFFQSWKSGNIVTTQVVKTLAEGLATSTAYELPLAMMSGRLDDLVLVSDREMMQAVLLLLETAGQVAELSGAASVAAACKLSNEIRGRKVVLLITGGNIQPEMLRRIMIDGSTSG